MNINELIFKALEDLGTKVYFTYKHNSDDLNSYVIFNVTSENDSAFADNKNEVVNYRILFRIYSKGDYTDIYNNLVKKLKENGFVKGIATSDFNDELLLYQKSVYFTKLIINQDT